VPNIAEIEFQVYELAPPAVSTTGSLRQIAVRLLTAVTDGNGAT